MTWNEEQITSADAGVNKVLTTMLISYMNMKKDETNGRYDKSKLESNIECINTASFHLSGVDPSSVFDCKSQKSSLIDANIRLSEREMMEAYRLARKGLELVIEGINAIEKNYDLSETGVLKQAYQDALSQIVQLNPIPLNNGK